MARGLTSGLLSYAWPVSRLAELVSALAQRAGLPIPAVEAPASAESIDRICAVLHLETDAIEIPGAAFNRRMRAAGPAVLRLQPGGWIGLLGMRGRQVRLLTPDLRLVRVPLDRFRREILRGLGSSHDAEIDRILEECAIPAARHHDMRQVLLEERLSETTVATTWPLRLPPGSPFLGQMHGAGLLGRLALLTGAHTGEYALWVVAWWLLGRGALNGQFDRGWLAAWALVLLTLLPLHLLATWLQGVLAVSLGGLLKQRLLAGALRLDPDRIRAEGAGKLLGRVIESELVESLAVGGGLFSVLAACELVLAAAVLAVGAGGWLHVGLLAVWVGLALFLAWRYSERRAAWTHQRLAMTHHLVESMSGHRTRLAQQPPEEWHQGEDQALENYLQVSGGLDRESGRLVSLIPRGWLLVGLLGMAPAFLSFQNDAAGVAIALGGLLLAQRALQRLVLGLSQWIGAGISWNQVAPLFHAAATPDEAGAPFVNPDRGPARLALEAQDLVFRYPGRAEPVLRNASLRIFTGDRLLLEGQSGGGKSSLVSVLAGLRKPTSGVVLAGGLDRQTLGARGWQRRVVAAPQVQENHIVAASLAFNLLLGRHWPASEEDLSEADAVCRELGLGPLLDRMPGGLQQMVGETGWQLSQGERGRIFLARALLQGADLVILDESFAALDPETLQQALGCAMERARSLMVIAHP
ncbi:MAG: ABC transporter ATP-binding protein/permease [Acidobacteriia bacterium]|nr:ABC transporter ATP-binding protein/permease [Terriglobia bacterium]